MILLTTCFNLSAMADDFSFTAPRSVYLNQSLSGTNHLTSTENEEAKKYFNQGLNYFLTFSEEEAYWSFQKAAKLDENFAMAYWGMAMTAGLSVDSDLTDKRVETARSNILQAVKLAGRLSSNEQAYIKAAEILFNEKLSTSDQLKKFTAKFKEINKNYPDDLTAKNILAISLLKLDSKDSAVLPLLDAILLKSPTHIGANTLAIYLALPFTSSLQGLLAAHKIAIESVAVYNSQILAAKLFFSKGRYQDAIKAALQATDLASNFLTNYSTDSYYPVDDIIDSQYTLALSYTLCGQQKEALLAAEDIQKRAIKYPEQLTELKLITYLLLPQKILIQFQEWEKIIKLSYFPQKYKYANCFLAFAKKIAQLNLPEDEFETDEAISYLAQKKSILADKSQTPAQIEANFKICDAVISAKINEVNQNFEEAVLDLEKAILLQEKNSSNELFFSLKEPLANLLLQHGRANKAESLFREALHEYPNSGWLLFGLYKSLHAQKKDSDAFWVENEFKNAWQNSSVKLQ